MLAVEDTRHTGIVKWYTDKGFGVIIDNETKQKLFAHHSEIKKGKTYSEFFYKKMKRFLF